MLLTGLTVDLALAIKPLLSLRKKWNLSICHLPVDDTCTVPARVAVSRVLTGPIRKPAKTRTPGH